jgi:hypothetical protein
MNAPSVTRCIFLLTTALALGVNISAGTAAGTHKKSPGAKTYHAKSSPRMNRAARHVAPKDSAARNSATSPSATVAKSSVKSSAVARPPAATRAVGKKSGRRAGKNSDRQRGQAVPTPARITEIQEALAKNGALSSTPSGRWDDSTTEAMRKFQAAHGLNPSGKLDARSLNQLGLGSATAGIAAPVPSSVRTSTTPVPSDIQQ